MFRQTQLDDPKSGKGAEVAAIIADEGLRYVSDTSPGYSRKRGGKSFSYFDKDGKRIMNPDVLRRIKSIGVPPAYEAVWICPSPNGHLQATGLDARGRKQYRYHAKWRELRDQDKYEHLMEFAGALPGLRRRVAADLRRNGLPREKVLATDSGDVNAYIKEITRQDFTAKDFRTWAGTIFAALALAEFKKYDSQAEAKRNVIAAIDKVAKQLGNACHWHAFNLRGDLLTQPFSDAAVS